MLDRWVPTGPKGINVDDPQCMGVGARFGATGHMFDSVNNPKRDILVRGTALSLLVGNSNGRLLLSLAVGRSTNHEQEIPDSGYPVARESSTRSPVMHSVDFPSGSRPAKLRMSVAQLRRTRRCHHE